MFKYFNLLIVNLLRHQQLTITISLNPPTHIPLKVQNNLKYNNHKQNINHQKYLNNSKQILNKYSIKDLQSISY